MAVSVTMFLVQKLGGGEASGNANTRYIGLTHFFLNGKRQNPQKSKLDISARTHIRKNVLFYHDLLKREHGRIDLLKGEHGRIDLLKGNMAGLTC